MKGSRWFAQLSDELEQINFGIICVTPDNLNAPWLLFEAGALSKSVGHSRVTPLLLCISTSDLQGPLAQFNATSVSEADLKRLVRAINLHLGEKEISEKQLDKSFELTWPTLEKRIDELLEESSSFITRSAAQGVSIPGVQAKLLPNEEVAFEYMAERILRAKSRIDHAALTPPIQRIKAPSKKWEESIEMILKANKITYRYVALLTDDARRNRVEQHLSDSQIERYYVEYYSPSESRMPALSFILIDKSEVIMHYPFKPGEEETFLAIKHQDIARLFVRYYERLWNQATPLNHSNLKDVIKSFKENAT